MVDLVDLHARGSLKLRLFRERKGAGIVVVFKLRSRRCLVRALLAKHRLFRPNLGGVVAAQDRMNAGKEPLADFHAPEMLRNAGRPPLLRRVQNRFVAEYRLVPGDGIGQYQGVLGPLVLEEIVDAFFLQQALHEVQIALAELHAVLAHAIGMMLDRPGVHVGQVAQGQHRLRDGHGVLRGIVEHATVPRLLENAQLRLELGRVARVGMRGVLLGKIGHDAVKQAMRAAVERDAHGERLAEHGASIDIRILRKQTEIEQVWPTELLPPLQGLKKQNALLKGPRHRGIAS